jgi:hypothetical protein
MWWLPYFVALIVLVFSATKFTFYIRGQSHREKRTQNLIKSILTPMAKPVPFASLEPRDGPIPSPAYKRLNLKTFFKATGILLERREEGLFCALRKEVFDIAEDDYRAQFRYGTLSPGGNLGFSGAAFFFTPNGKKYVVKSLPNEFEWKFFYSEFLISYCKYMLQHKDSLLSRITDALFNFDYRFWNLVRLGTASHFLVMPNMLQGFDAEKGCRQWDLKPKDYLRADLLMPMSAEDSEKLLFKRGGLILTHRQYEELKGILERDTKFLAERKVVDYSLLLGEFPVAMGLPIDNPPNFRTGVISADGKSIYRLGIIDFFFSHKTAPTVIQNAGDLIPGETEFTFSDSPASYRQNFLKMVDEYVVTKYESQSSRSVNQILAKRLSL